MLCIDRVKGRTSMEHLSDPVIQILQLVTSTYFLEIVVFPGLISIAILGAFFTWFERKLTARVQLRIGPSYSSPVGGILQGFADIIKLLFKELIIQEGADRFFFIMSPVTTQIIDAALLHLISFAPGLQIPHT